LKNKPLNKTEQVKRSYSIENFRATDEGSIIEGHAAVYNQRTTIGNWFYEVIERGAFDSCNFDDVLLSANHEWEKIPLARSRRNNGNSTMQLTVDDKGLYVKAELDIEGNTEAKSLYSAVKRGDIDGMSLIFYVEEERWTDLDKDMPTRYISKIKRVREVSAVNYPAYEGTDINARATLDNEKIVLDNARANIELDNSKEIEKLRLQTKIILNGGL